MTGNEIKAVALLSGGLDSAIAAKLIANQEIDVYGLNFHSPFCICNSKSKLYQCGAVYFAEKIGIPVKMLKKEDDYLQLIKHPKFGYGKNLNPCIDCRIYILKKTKEYAREIGAQFIITGEVLGQRPKSQMMETLQLIEKEAGLERLVLRPLSAKFFPKTEAEEVGWVNRDMLYNIQGRRRNVQLELGRKFELIHQYCATGGCLLTNANFARRMWDYLQHAQSPHIEDIKYLKVGRHFRFQGIKMIVGRDERECKWLAESTRENDVIIDLKSVPGPTTFIEHPISEEQVSFAAQLTVHYSDSETTANDLVIRDHSGHYRDFSIEIDPKINFEAHKV